MATILWLHFSLPLQVVMWVVPHFQIHPDQCTCPTMSCTGHLEIKHTLWLFNIAMENGPFIDGLPIKNGDFPRQTVK